MYDLALDIDNNDNQMTFVGLFVSLVASFAPSLRSRADDVTRATNEVYALQKSCDCSITSEYMKYHIFELRINM